MKGCEAWKALCAAKGSVVRPAAPRAGKRRVHGARGPRLPSAGCAHHSGHWLRSYASWTASWRASSFPATARLLLF